MSTPTQMTCSWLEAAVCAGLVALQWHAGAEGISSAMVVCEVLVIALQVGAAQPAGWGREGCCGLLLPVLPPLPLHARHSAGALCDVQSVPLDCCGCSAPCVVLLQIVRILLTSAIPCMIIVWEWSHAHCCLHGRRRESDSGTGAAAVGAGGQGGARTDPSLDEEGASTGMAASTGGHKRRHGEPT
jgi:hypothetical protein